MPDANVYLTGASGCGKSTIAPLLARALGYEVLDIDDAIVARARIPIATIFAQSGESAFRTYESEAIADAASRSRHVVALGGGALIDPANVALVRATGTLVHLRATPETLVARLDATAVATRPLFADAGDVLVRVRSLVAAREQGYAHAHRTIDVDTLTPEEVVRWIVRSA